MGLSEQYVQNGLIRSIKIGAPISPKEKLAVDWFFNLTPEEKLFQLVYRYEDNFNDQQKALEAVSDD